MIRYILITVFGVLLGSMGTWMITNGRRPPAGGDRAQADDSGEASPTEEARAAAAANRARAMSGLLAVAASTKQRGSAPGAPEAAVAAAGAAAAEAATRAAAGDDESASSPPVTPERLRTDLANMAKSRTGMMMAGPSAVKLATEVKQLGLAGVAVTLDELRDPDSTRRMQAAVLLGQLDESNGIPALADTAMHDKDPKVAAVASQSLALMDNPDTEDALRALLAAPNGAATEINAIYGLCKYGDPDGISRATDFLQDPSRSTQEKQVLAANLALLSRPELMPVIDLAVTMFATSSSAVLMNAINYYKALGSPDSKARLARLASDDTISPALRQAAAAAAGTG